MSDELTCPICGEEAEIIQIGVSLWVVKHEVDDRHIVRVTGKTREEAIAAWNKRVELDGLPGWAIDKINAELKRQHDTPNAHSHLVKPLLKWVLSLKRGEE